MPRVVDAEARVPIHLWGRTIPSGALEQLRALAAQPYVTQHIAAMPDLHVAHGVAVGTVFTTEDTLVPSSLGGDLGCGMSAIRFDFPAARIGRSQLTQLIEAIARHIPLGDSTHRGKRPALPDVLRESPLSTGTLEHARERLGPKHLGTLGGGNHFIELDRDSGGDVWVLVHSGSRGLGAAIGAHHTRAASHADSSSIPGLRVDSPAGRACVADIDWALNFARANRDVLVERTVALISDVIGCGPDEGSRIDVHHNFVRRETHFGRALWVHRKGAIAAPIGERALIPGSMATASYIVEGLGSPDSFGSASHGAGRVMTRREARQQIRPDRFTHSMRRIVFDTKKAAALVEEAAAAYRDIGDVLEDEADLVRPLIRLEPLAVVKG